RRQRRTRSGDVGIVAFVTLHLKHELSSGLPSVKRRDEATGRHTGSGDFINICGVESEAAQNGRIVRVSTVFEWKSQTGELGIGRKIVVHNSTRDESRCQRR